MMAGTSCKMTKRRTLHHHILFVRFFIVFYPLYMRRVASARDLHVISTRAGRDLRKIFFTVKKKKKKTLTEMKK